MNRNDNLARLGAEEFDLAVIGGGINGGAAARDAAMRGLKVALIDQADFASATSSRSSKLIHGGIRYLPQGQIRLVYKALRERELLRHRTAPHLVHPIRFLMPSYRERGYGRFAMGVGLWLYDLFARPPRDERHSRLSAPAALAMEPELNPDGLTGGALYYDGWADDARLTFENVLDAALNGAAVANYVGLERFITRGDRIVSAAVRDRLGERSFELRARVFLNATGPWVDHVRRLDDPEAQPSVRLTKGVHLIFRHQALPVRESLVLSDDRGRIVFVMPHRGYVLVGTTDTDFVGDPASVTADPADVAYLVAVLRQSLPRHRPEGRDVVFSFAGLRALVRWDPGRSPSAVPREEVVLRSDSGLITLAGGKLTTHRDAARKIVDRIMTELGRRPGRCPTRTTPLPGARGLTPAEAQFAGAAAMANLSPEACRILVARYGTRAALVARIAADRPELMRPLAPDCPVLGAEAVHAVRFEMAQSLGDFVLRRTSLAWRHPLETRAALPEAARLMGAELGWNPARVQSEVANLKREIESHASP